MRNIIVIIGSVLLIALAVVYFQTRSGDAPETLPPEEALTPAPAPQPQPQAQTETQTPPQEEETQVEPPSFDVVRVSREGTGVVAGRAEPNSEVTVLADDRVIGRATANRNGEWVLIFEEPLKPGSRTLSIKARRGSAAPVDSDQVVVLSIPEREGDRPDDQQGEGVIAVLTPRDGLGPSEVLQQPEQSSGPLDSILTVDTLDYDGQGNAVFTGRAMPTGEIRLYLDGTYLDTVTADSDGRWIYQPKEEIPTGQHVLRLDQVLEGDNVRLRIEQPFNREEPLDTQLAEGQVEIQPGNNLWEIARQVYGAGIMYTLIFQENQDRIVDPDMIYPDQLFTLPRTPGDDDASGNAGTDDGS